MQPEPHSRSVPAGQEDAPASLEDARSSIDRVDAAIVELVAERLRAVRAIGTAKAEGGHDVFDPGREAAVRATWLARAREQDLPPRLVHGLLDRLIEASRRAQEPRESQPGTLTRVAYQGEPGCYSDHATQKLFELRGASRVDRVPCTTVMAAARLVREGRVDYALLPIENSLVGSVPDTNSVLVQGDLRIADEEVLEIRHVLAAIPGARRENVETVHSHPIALRQCQSLLAESPAPRAVEAHDTAGAARLVAESGDPSAAALCSEAAALEHGLEVIARDVADADSNMTRFVLVGREEAPPPAGARTKTSLLVTAAHRSGSLAGFLGCLAARGVNLTRIESRPQFDRPWEYLFLVDVEGSAHAEPLQSALEAAREHCSSLRSIGSYPSRTHMPRTVEPSPAAAVTTSPLRVVEYVERRAQASRVEPDEQRRVRPIELGGVEVGGDAFLLIAGPCAVESEEQIHAAAAAVAARGVRLMRAGAFKPRTSPRSFQGHGAQGLRWLREAADAHGLGVVTEVLSTDDLPLLARHADVLQVGARNMQNFELLKALGRADLPVLLKRGMSATLDELLGAVDYVIGGGNQRVVLCERGIRTFETSTRFSLDIGAIVALGQRTELPIIVDPSHAAGRRSLVSPLALAAAAAGADGLIVEVHPDPESALCDKEQALHPEDLDALIEGLRPVLAPLERTLAPALTPLRRTL